MINCHGENCPYCTGNACLKCDPKGHAKGVPFCCHHSSAGRHGCETMADIATAQDCSTDQSSRKHDPDEVYRVMVRAASDSPQQVQESVPSHLLEDLEQVAYCCACSSNTTTHAAWVRVREFIIAGFHANELPPKARPIDEYHEDMGYVTWWKFPIDEPAWIGTPNCSDWPGYHTHFTPAPKCPEIEFCEYCGGNDESPQDHTEDCGRPE